MPWLAALGTLEWRLGEIAVAVEEHAIGLDDFAAFADIALEQLCLQLQSGLAYQAADWPVDDLVRFRIEGNAPDELPFEPTPVWLELRGARGRFTIARFDPGSYAFRAETAAGAPLAVAIAAATQADATFDAGAALAALFADRLVTRIGITEAR